MKKAWLLILLAVLVILVCACNTSGDSAPSPTPEPTLQPTLAATPTPVPTPTRVPTPSPSPGPGEVSKLSGIPFSEFTADMNQAYTPVAVMIENSSAARPQYGLQSANIVYEAPVEGDITRFMAIFNDVLPERVEPVRSARIYFIKMQQPYDCVYVHFGGPSDRGYDSYIYDKDSKHIKIRVDGIKGRWTDYFVRDSERRGPHNVITDLTQVVQLYDYQPEPIPFRYNYDDGSTYEGEPISEISLPFFGGKDYVSYRYDPQTNLLSRYMDNDPFLAAETDEAVTVQNLIVQYAHFYHGDELAGRRLAKVLGTGAAAFVIDGVYIEGTWSRENYEDATKYYDQDGNEIVLTPGNTWIALHPDTEEAVVAY